MPRPAYFPSPSSPRAARRLVLMAVAGLLAAGPASAKAQDVMSLNAPLPEGLASRIDGAQIMDDAGQVPGSALIYGGQAGADTVAALAELPDGAIVVFTNCAAGEAMSGLQSVSARIMVPANTACDVEGLADGFAKAALAAPDERLAILETSGFRALAAGEDPAPRAAAIGGGLVISAMPIETISPSGGGSIVLANLGETPVDPRPAPFATITDAQPSRPGLPEPSIVVGDLAVLMTTGERGPLGMPFTSRETIRQRDPAMFERLVSQGAFDPAEGQIAAAIQTELLRMGCYRGTVDGDWGAGSTSALERYAETGGAAGLSGADPDVTLFRAVIRADEVACPAPAQPTPTVARNRPSGGGGGGAAAPARTNSQPAASGSRTPRQAPPPAETPPAERRLDPGRVGFGLGIRG